MFPDAFLANYALHADFAKPAKFMALIFQPTGLIAGGLLGGLIGRTITATGFTHNPVASTLLKGINTTSLSFQCDTAVLPEYNINTVDQQVHGAKWRTAATPVHGDLPLTFICAGDMWERKFFEDWMDFILPKGDTNISIQNQISKFVNMDGSKSGQGLSRYRDEYISTIEIIQFHDTGIPSARYKFEECFPFTMQAQPLDWSSGDVHKLAVTFAYKTWRREENFLKQIYDQFKVKSSIKMPDILDWNLDNMKPPQ
jgi:hypothetical protein